MRRRIALAVAVALSVPTAAFVPLVFAAGPSGAPASSPSGSAAPPSTARPYDPNNQTNISEYMLTCLQGNAKYLSRDFPGAVEMFRKAIQMNVRDPLGYYLMGEAQLAQGNMAETEAAWLQGLRVSEGWRDPALRGRLLFVTADLKERQKKFTDARAAWQAYNDWAAQYGAIVAPAAAGEGGAPPPPPAATDGGPAFGVFGSTGVARIQAIDAMMKQDQDYEKVRRNIQISTTTDGGLFSVVEGGPG